MSSNTQTDIDAVVTAARHTGARPFKAATGNWSTAVEVALLDVILSIGAQVDGVYGAGVLPRLRAFKAFRGQANMMRVVATLGPFGLADFVPEQHQIHCVMSAAAALLDAGVNGAEDVDPTSSAQRAALVATEGVPELAWEYFLVALDRDTPEVAQQKTHWLDEFVTRALGGAVPSAARRDALLAQATAALDGEHQRRTFGHMPEFTVPQLHQGIFRAEYARATT